MTANSVVLKSATVVLLLLSLVFPDENKVGTYNIGLAAGFVTGYGLSYRQWFGKNGVQVTLAPYYSRDSMETNFTMSFGVVGLRMLKEARFVNLFAYYGGQYWYSYDKQSAIFYNYPDGPTIQPATITKSKRIFVGGGPGLDIHFWKLSFNVMFGLAFTSNLAKSSGVQFTGETGLYYSF
jgi:hypothetical protein